MKDIIHRYDTCLICNQALDIKYFDGHSLSGSLKKIGDSYLLNYNNKSKIHKVVFDLHFRIIENDGYPDTFFLVKYCTKCDTPDFIDPPFFTIDKLKKTAMFYMFYLNNKKKENIVLLEELVRCRRGDMSYGWHAKFNAKKKVWNSSIMVTDTTKTMEQMFMKHLESNNYHKFNNIEEVVDKLSMLHTFS